MYCSTNDRFVLKIFFPNHILIFILLVMVITTPLYSQERCATVQYMQLLRNEGKIKQTEEQFEQALQQRIKNRQLQQQTHRTHGGPYQVPVVVHVIHNDELIGTGSNISEAQILSQIDVLNKDFKRLNDDANNTPAQFLPNAGSFDIEFVMARRDPSGLPTNGINRVKGTRATWTMSNDAEFKGLSYWPSEDYLNIWVIDFSGSFIGYAQFPVSTMQGLEDYQNSIAATDGIAIDYKAFGTIDAGPFDLDSRYNRGRTTTHEVGHFFGLRHIWGDNDCGTDYVTDTPQQKNSTTTCPSHPQSTVCGTSIVKMFQNFLDYTDDACMNIFTQGQVSRMETIIDDANVPRRNSLLNSPGLLNPNCSVIDVAILSVESPGPVTCDENAIFKIKIKNRSCSDVNSVKVEYTVNQGNLQTNTITLSPSLSINGSTNLTIPAVNFQEGLNTITLTITQVNTVSDDDPSNNTLASTIVVDKTQDKIPLRENFNTLVWPIVSPQMGINWQLTSTNFGLSASVQAFNAGTVGTEAWLVTPTLDFSGVSQASVFFDLSYGYNETDFDRLKVFASGDCGVTYNPLNFDKAGPDLANIVTTSSWLPTTSDKWHPKKYINLNDLAGLTNVRLAFVFTNASGNNIYLDNIEFFTSDNPEPVTIGNDLFSVYWKNETEASLTFNLPERMPVRIQVIDIMGRMYFDTLAPDILNQTFPVDLEVASSGIYILRVQIGNQFFVTKFYLSR